MTSDIDRSRSPLICFVNLWSDDNKGDCAIVQGLAGSLRDRIGLVRIEGVSEFGIPNPELATAHRMVEGDAFIERVHASMYPAITNQPAGEAVVKRVLYLLRAILVLAVPSAGALLLRSSERSALNAIASADVVVSKGGQFIHTADRSWRSQVNLFRKLFPLLVARRLKRPTVIYGQSFAGCRGKAARWLARGVLDDARFVGVRESMSTAEVSELAPSARVVECPDAAFLLGRIVPVARSAPRSDRPLLVVSVRQWFFGRDASAEGSYATYMRAVEAFIREQVRAGWSVELIAHTNGPTAGEDDRRAVQDLAGLLSDVPPVTCLMADLDPVDLVRRYGDADAVLATRFHAAILSLVGGTVPVVIAYHGPKAEGIMQDVGLAELVVPIERCTVDAIQIAMEKSLAMPDGAAEAVVAEQARRSEVPLRELIEAAGGSHA